MSIWNYFCFSLLIFENFQDFLRYNIIQNQISENVERRETGGMTAIENKIYVKQFLSFLGGQSNSK